MIQENVYLLGIIDNLLVSFISFFFALNRF